MNLLLRSITSIVLLSAISWLIFFESAYVFEMVTIALSACIAFEWGYISGLKSHVERWLYATSNLVLLLLAYQDEAVLAFLMDNVLTAIVVAWIFVAGLIITYKTGRYKMLLSHTGAKLVFGIMVITGFWISLRYLYLENLWLLIMLAVSGIVFDSCAYVVGKVMGHHRLCPDISPGKTWEGLTGGAVVAILVFLAIVITLISLQILKTHTLIDYMILAFVGVACAVFGDLTESLIKRVEGIKDSSNILPGHGGLLDRFDGHLATIPVCTYLVGYLDI